MNTKVPPVIPVTFLLFLVNCAGGNEAGNSPGLLPIPDKLVVLTFDDGNISDIKYTAPLLKKYGFGATFFISSNSFLGAPGTTEGRMSWDQIKKLDEMGFEIGNHSTTHPPFTGLSQEETLLEIEGMENECLVRGITKPVSFAFPGGHAQDDHFSVFEQKGYTFVRRGANPESPNMEGGARGSVYEPGRDHPYAIPTTIVFGGNSGIDDLSWAVEQARDGKICIITLHGVPDVYPHVTVSPKEFENYMEYLHDQGCTVIAQRDLARYVDPSLTPRDVFGVIYERLCSQPSGLKCENESDPDGINTSQPVLSWEFRSIREDRKPSAWQILVASSEDKINDDLGDMWDSGKVPSGQNENITYTGKPLTGNHTYFWKVRCWNEPGELRKYESEEYYDSEILAALRSELVSDYSSPARFTTGTFE